MKNFKSVVSKGTSEIKDRKEARINKDRKTLSEAIVRSLGLRSVSDIKTISQKEHYSRLMAEGYDGTMGLTKRGKLFVVRHQNLFNSSERVFENVKFGGAARRAMLFEDDQPAPANGQQPAPAAAPAPANGQQPAPAAAPAPANGQQPAPANGQQPAPANGQQPAQPGTLQPFEQAVADKALNISNQLFTNATVKEQFTKFVQEIQKLASEKSDANLDYTGADVSKEKLTEAVRNSIVKATDAFLAEIIK